jgi:histidinol dehydrogenase
MKKVDPDKWDKIVQRMKDKEKRKVMDKNVEKVITQLRDREEEGLRKYGVNTERTDLTTLQWLQHLQEELMDASVYIEKLKNEMKEIQDEMSGKSWGPEDFDSIQYHGKTKNYKQQKENDDGIGYDTGQ